MFIDFDREVVQSSGLLAFRTFSIYVKVSAIQWSSIHPRLFDHKAHTGMQPLKAFQSHHCCLNTERTKERKRRIRQRLHQVDSIIKTSCFRVTFCFHSAKYSIRQIFDCEGHRWDELKKQSDFFLVYFSTVKGDQIKKTLNLVH